MSAHRDRAVTLLVNYFEAIARKAGMKWDGDYTAEIGEAVDEIVAAAVESMQERVIASVRSGIAKAEGRS